MTDNNNNNNNQPVNNNNNNNSNNSSESRSAMSIKDAGPGLRERLEDRQHGTPQLDFPIYLSIPQLPSSPAHIVSTPNPLSSTVKHQGVPQNSQQQQQQQQQQREPQQPSPPSTSTTLKSPPFTPGTNLATALSQVIEDSNSSGSRTVVVDFRPNESDTEQAKKSPGEKDSRRHGNSPAQRYPVQLNSQGATINEEPPRPNPGEVPPPEDLSDESNEADTEAASLGTGAVSEKSKTQNSLAQHHQQQQQQQQQQNQQNQQQNVPKSPRKDTKKRIGTGSKQGPPQKRQKHAVKFTKENDRNIMEGYALYKGDWNKVIRAYKLTFRPKEVEKRYKYLAGQRGSSEDFGSSLSSSSGFEVVGTDRSSSIPATTAAITTATTITTTTSHLGVHTENSAALTASTTRLVSDDSQGACFGPRRPSGPVGNGAKIPSIFRLRGHGGGDNSNSSSSANTCAIREAEEALRKKEQELKEMEEAYQSKTHALEKQIASLTKENEAERELLVHHTQSSSIHNLSHTHTQAQVFICFCMFILIHCLFVHSLKLNIGHCKQVCV